MYGSKFATALSKALAARSSTEFAAAVATATTVVVVASSNNGSRTSREEEQQQQQQLKHSSSCNQSSSFSLPPLRLPQTLCQQLVEAPDHHRHAGAEHSPPVKNRFSRLGRHRTIEKLRETETRGTLEAKYDLDHEHPLGEGAFGAVFTAQRRTTREKVAIKKIPKQFTSDTNFQREMHALLHIRRYGGHPNICGLRENFDEGSYYYLVLDLVAGGEMFDHLCNLGPYSEADAARLVREVASALAFCHGVGLVHGDLVRQNYRLFVCTVTVCKAMLYSLIRMTYFSILNIETRKSHAQYR